MSHQEESQSTPALIHVPQTLDLTSSLGIIPENTLLESYTRLSVSLEENGLFQASSRSSSNGSHHSRHAGMTLDELRAINRYAESTKSLSYLPQVKYNALFILISFYMLQNTFKLFEAY